MKRRLSSHVKEKVPPAAANSKTSGAHATASPKLPFVEDKMAFPMKRLHFGVKIVVGVVLIVVSVQVYLALNVPGLSSRNLAFPPSEQTQHVKGKCVMPNETVSAIARAKTNRCKKEFEELACSIQRGDVYPSHFQSYCDENYDESRAGQRVGCFKDSVSDRILKGAMVKYRDNNPVKCVSTCGQYGYEFAGLQYAVECFCGNSLVHDFKTDDAKCNKVCPGDKGSNCGGYLAMDVYHTGVTPIVPPKLGLEPEVGNNAEKDIGIVFLLTLNGRALHQVHRLIHRLDGPRSYFYIHVDARQSYLYKKLEELASTRSNIRMAPTRFTTIWGGSSLLSMLLACIKDLLTISQWKWDFVLNLSESDYPVKTRDELFDFLSANKNSNFVKSHGRQLSTFIKKQGLDRTFYQCEDRMWRLGSRELPSGIQWDGGSDWICLNRNFSDYVVNSNDSLITNLKTFFNLTLLPAESFFHVAIRNSRYFGSYINNNLHLTNWNRKQGCKCQYKSVVDWCGCSPNDFLKTDWHKIHATRPKQLFFARKFEPIIQAGILNKIDEWTGVQAWPQPNKYWQSVYSRQYDSAQPSSEFLVLFEFVSRNYLDRIEMQDLGSESRKAGPYTFVHINEVLLFKHHDVLDSILVDVRVRDESRGSGAALDGTHDTPLLDVQLRIEMDDTLIEDARLSHLSAGTLFDPKEQVFRNFIRLITTNDVDKLRGRAVFTGGKTNETYELSWLSPKGDVRAVNSVEVDANAVIAELEGLSKVVAPVLDAGMWRLVCTHNGNLVHAHPFLVLPSMGDNSGNADKSSILGEGESDLSAWMKKFVPQFYNVTEHCLREGERDEGRSCEQTAWSSVLYKYE